MNTLRIKLPELHDKQAQIKAEYVRFNVLDAGRRFGKNILEHDFTVTGILQGWPVGWGSPTYKNLTEDWRTLTGILAPITSRISEQERRIETVTGGTLEMWTLDNPAPIRGRAYKRFVLNEAATVKKLMDTWNEIIRPTLIDLHGDALFGSTPEGLNDFHTIYNWGLGGMDDWKSWHFTSYDNPYLDPNELNTLRSTLSDRQFRQEIMAEFIQNDAAVFRNLDAALTSTYDTPDKHKGHMLVAGVDWGKMQDFTVLAVGCADCKRELEIDRFNQIDYHFQVQRLEALHNKWGVRKWLCELNSIGSPTFEALQRRGLPVQAFSTTLTSKQPLIEAFSLALERVDLQLLPDDVGRAELQAYEVTRTETGLSKYSVPSGMHDDTVIARALMWRAMQQAPRQVSQTDTARDAALSKFLNQRR